MTSALPYFMLPLSKIMIALNQNLVKTETSKAFTPLERQVLGMLHHLVYGYEDAWYRQWMHDPIRPLWRDVFRRHRGQPDRPLGRSQPGVSRRRRLPGVNQEGLFRALRFYGYEGSGHTGLRAGSLLPLRKAADILGLGRDFLIPVATDADSRIDPDALRDRCLELQQQKIRVLSIVGIAGTTETGHVDPLETLADIAREFGAHFHVDAAWGPTLFSGPINIDSRASIRRIPSPSTPTSSSTRPRAPAWSLFRNPSVVSSIELHAQYVIRKGSKDMGSTTLEGSRPGMAMLIHSGLRIIGREGYEILIDQGIEKSRGLCGDDPQA